MLVRRHRWNADQIALLPVPALTVVDVVALSLEHQNQFFRYMAMLTRTSARFDLLKIDPSMVGRGLRVRMDHPFDLALARLFPQLLGVARDVIDFAAEVSLVMHQLDVPVIGGFDFIRERSRRAARLEARFAIWLRAEDHFDVLGDAEDAFLDAIALK